MLKNEMSPAPESSKAGPKKLVLVDKQTIASLLLRYESEVKVPSDIPAFVEEFIAGQSTFIWQYGESE
jgi:hypothetical protein